MNKLLLPFFLLTLMILPEAHSALYTEIGLNYNYKKTYFDATNNTEQQSSTYSLSLYFWEKVALELSYTDGLAVKKEKDPSNPNDFVRQTTQTSKIYGSDLIFIFADKKAVFQPYLKGGVAYITKKMTVQDDNNNSWPLNPAAAFAPSAGVGFKFFITDAFAIRTCYDLLETPTEDSGKVYDINGRVGLTWSF